MKGKDDDTATAVLDDDLVREILADHDGEPAPGSRLVRLKQDGIEQPSDVEADEQD